MRQNGKPVESVPRKSYMMPSEELFSAENHGLKMQKTETGSEFKLRKAGLRPTRQRISLADLLFAKGDRHLTVEELATVYNTLHQFTEAGIIRVLAVESAKTYFDTNTSDHHHFFVEGRNHVLDIPVSNISIGNLPEPPEGMEIAHVDVVIRLRPKSS